MQSFVDTVRISELNKTKDVLAFLVGVLSGSLDSRIQNNATLVSDLEEVLQILKVDVVDWMNPNGSLQSVGIQIFQFLQSIDGDC